jgi:hypothetical protein
MDKLVSLPIENEKTSDVVCNTALFVNCQSYSGNYLLISDLAKVSFQHENYPNSSFKHDWLH